MIGRQDEALAVRNHADVANRRVRAERSGHEQIRADREVGVHDADEGGFWAEVPGIAGCVTQGDTFEELLQNLYEAVEGSLSVDVQLPPDDPSQRLVDIAV